MKFCSVCGQPVVQRIPEGDNRLRFVCDNCGTIHYQNPRIIAGCLPLVGDQILLCRRAIEPRHGLWTLPAGFMENGETTQQAAERETWEEAEAKVEVHDLYAIYNLPHINQVYFFYRGDVINGEFGVGEESLETQLFSKENIPWNELAFSTVKQTLEFFIADHANGTFPIRVEDLEHRPHTPHRT